MLFVVSLTLSLLTLTAGLFLLIKSKQEPGKFFKVMSWIIISGAFLAILMLVHLAVIKFHGHRGFPPFKEKHAFYSKDDLPFDKCSKFKDACDDECFSGKDCDSDTKIVTIKKEISDDNFNPELQSKAIVKIISDNIKLTPDQEKNIKTAIDESFKMAKDVEVTKETKK